jgi:tetratricopeptide (TPR) repeat protein
MQIIHQLDDFFYTIFPALKTCGEDELVQRISDYYSYGPYKPKVILNNNLLTVEIDVPTIFSQKADFEKATNFCEKGRYKEAKPILNQLIQKNPTNSEYHRIMGQILSDEGDQEAAIDYLISALRWDTKNGYALVMMGNIFSKYLNDTETAMKYYNQASVVNPKDYISINNIASTLLQLQKFEEAKAFFEKALIINPKYPNTCYGLSLLAEKEGNLNVAFHQSLTAIKYNKNQDNLYHHSLKMAVDTAKKLIESETGKEIYLTYIQLLERKSAKKIKISADSSIATAAKIEFAENYSRDFHLVKYKPEYPAFEHLVMHELVHLDLVISAREIAQNKLFISNENNRVVFLKKLEPTLTKLRAKAVPQKNIEAYANALFRGMNSQIYNTPIDLFIENYLFHSYESLRPYQFISLFNLLKEEIKAVTDKSIIDLSPKDILSKSKIYNLVNALQFRELYGIDLLNEYAATKLELKAAQDFHTEYLDYQQNKEPGEEYELLQHWAEDLGLSDIFELVDEDEFRKVVE